MNAVWRLALAVAATVLLAVGAGPAAADAKRVALVIGNADYRHANPLPNPANDARLIASSLREAGFDVLEKIDLDRVGMSESINAFTELAYDADVALIYYAGHGIQVDGSNYLIPVDAELTAPAHIRTRTISIDALVAALPPDPAVGIIILDACRDNPLADRMVAALPATRSLSVSKGLAPVQTVDAGMGAGGILIAYATDPGSVAVDGAGGNSPYSTALARHLTTPGLELQGALTRVRGDVTAATLGRQRPWHNASLGREIFLGGEPAAPAAEPKVSLVERVLWEEASKRDSVDFYAAYLDQYPKGHFASVARLNIDRLKKEAPTTDAVRSSGPAEDAQAATAGPVLVLGEGAQEQPEQQEQQEQPTPLVRPSTTALDEAALALDLAQREDLQMRLQALGLDPGPVDGDLGRASRRAIRTWQESAGFSPTGFLSGAQVAALVAATDPVMPELRLRREASLRQDAERQSPVLLAPAEEPDDVAPPPPVAAPPPEPEPGKQRIIRKKTSEERQRKPTETKTAPEKKVVKKRAPKAPQVQTTRPTPKKTERKQVAKAPTPKKPPPKTKVIGRDNIFGTGTIYGSYD